MKHCLHKLVQAQLGVLFVAWALKEPLAAAEDQALAPFIDGNFSVGDNESAVAVNESARAAIEPAALGNESTAYGNEFPAPGSEYASASSQFNATQENSTLEIAWPPPLPPETEVSEMARPSTLPPGYLSQPVPPCPETESMVFPGQANASNASGSEPGACTVESCRHGTCIEGTCSCLSGWGGADCDYFVGVVSEPILGCADRAYCSERGKCISGLCECYAGWTGLNCATEVVCPMDCNSPSGSCVNGVCVCNRGFNGTACQEVVCLNDCWGHGACYGGHCVCDEGWGGDECEQLVRAFLEVSPTTTSSPPPAEPDRAAIEAQADAAAAEGFDEAVDNITNGSLPLPELTTSLPPEVETLPDNGTHAKLMPAAEEETQGANGSNSMVNGSGLEAGNSPLVSPPPPPPAPTAGETLPPLLTPAPSSPSSTLCPDDCSGHGDCTDSGCSCTDDWEGEACDVPACPGGCNSRGMCLDGECVCHQSYYGSQCQYERCPQDCSGNGHCEKGQCVCNYGYAGVGCATKSVAVASTPAPVAFLHGSAKISKVQKCPEDCNGNGKCNADGSCSCLEGFSGVACQDFCPSGCSGKGVCTGGQCVCLAGFSGPDCSMEVCCSGHGDCPAPEQCICSPGWTGEQCEVKMVCPDATCSGHGQCIHGACECEAGWSGPVCGHPPRECGAPCPPGGFCDRATGTCLCGSDPCSTSGTESPPRLRGWLPSAGKGVAKTVLSKPHQPVPPPHQCNEPHGHWDVGIGACQCEAAWSGEHCEQQHCPGFSEEFGTPDCSARGLCVEGVCHCAMGWGKANPTAPGPNMCAEQVCTYGCGQHGVCRDGACACDQGWQGPTCEQPSCPNDCSGHGTCQVAAANLQAECICEEGYAMPDCAEKELVSASNVSYGNLTTCINDCSGNGLCMNGQCLCEENFALPDCSTRELASDTQGENNVTTLCPRDCSGNGLCFGGSCTCDDLHTGPDCSLPLSCLQMCGGSCLPDNIESQQCELCKGQCLMMAANGIIGARPVQNAR